MKTILTQSTSLFLATTMLFASCAGNPEVFDVTNDELETTKDKVIPLSVTIQKIDDINANLPEPTTDVNSRGILRDAYIVYNDVKYARKGARVGCRVGGFIGSLFGGTGAAPGAIAGGIVGGLIGGIGGSYVAYKDSEDWEEFILPPEYVMDECASLEEDPEACVAFDEIEVPDSIERIGYIHNLALDALINGESDFAFLSEEPPFLDKDDPGEVDYHRVITFTQFDKDVIASDDYRAFYNQITQPGESSEEDITQITISDQVIDYYLDALAKYTSPLDYKTVVSITNQYIAVVNDSTELTDEDKNSLYIAFSVGVYSYKYWSNFDSGTTAEEE